MIWGYHYFLETPKWHMLERARKFSVMNGASWSFTSPTSQKSSGNYMPMPVGAWVCLRLGGHHLPRIQRSCQVQNNQQIVPWVDFTRDRTASSRPAKILVTLYLPSILTTNLPWTSSARILTAKNGGWGYHPQKPIRRVTHPPKVDLKNPESWIRTFRLPRPIRRGRQAARRNRSRIHGPVPQDVRGLSCLNPINLRISNWSPYFPI